MEHRNKILVTQPYLPPLEELNEYLKEIWDSKWLTNNGKFHQEFEKQLAEYFNVPYISLFSNGTLALVTALQVLKITGEVITTPYSFVATTHALWWNNIKPVFVDIEPNFLNLNPNKIEAALTPKTTAILPVHVYGNPCDVYRLQELADVYGLKLIYDAAHAFGVKLNNKSILNFGELSVLSFHATKIYNTFEGGAIISHDASIKKRIDYLKNFGFAGETTVIAPGINAKMNEFQAALGLLQLKHFNEVIDKRKAVSKIYCNELANIRGLTFLNHSDEVDYNYAYFPIFINEIEYGRSRDELYEFLKSHGIYGRRYFYPLISQFPTYRGIESANPARLPVSEKITKEVICLPIYPDLDKDDQDKVIEKIIEFRKE
jgi:dTDP-4-amino-4,6-dideoxygalactose transaminase